MNQWTRAIEPWSRDDVWSFEQTVSATLDRLTSLRNPDPDSWQAQTRVEVTNELVAMVTELVDAIDNGYVYLVADEELNAEAREKITAA